MSENVSSPPLVPTIGSDDFVTDAELIRRLNLPEKVGRLALRELDKHMPGRRRFPQPIALFGNRRYWPAVKQYCDAVFGGSLSEAPQPAISWKENFDAPEKANPPRRPVCPRPDLASSR